MSTLECQDGGMSLRHAVLGMLSAGPASGYDLLKRFELSLGNVWSATQSQLYGELTRMADDGLLEIAAEGPRGRKEYAITTAGSAELRHWLTEVEPEPPRRNAMLLRVFFLHLLDPAEARAYLRRQAELAAERHRELTKLVDLAHDGDAENFYGRLALEFGLRHSTFIQDWADWADSEIKGRS
jgi:PadR family transcriptional regulator, regulatory protein AphA